MIMETFKKVYVKSEADLPKESGYHFVCHKDQRHNYYAFDNDGPFENRDYWSKHIDWYLIPDEKPEKKPPTDEDIRKQSETEIDPTINVDFNDEQSSVAKRRRLWSYGAKWMRDQIFKPQP